MKTATLAITFVIAALGLSSTSTAEAPVPLPTPVVVAETITVTETFKDRVQKATLEERRTLLKAKVIEVALEYGVNAEQVYRTIASCENTAIEPDLQSGHRYGYDNPRWGTVAGERERSYGLAQIHLPSHPTVTKEQATDPDFAITFMVKEFSKGNQRAWTCWRKLYEVQYK